MARHNFSVLLSNLMGLILVLAIETILNILVCTRQSSTPKTAYRRYLRTFFHVLNFYEFLPEKDSKCVQSIVEVRQKHSRNSKMVHKRGLGVISQRDMAITQFGFMGLTLLKPKQFGIRCSEKDLDAIAHLWRVVGHMLGIEDEFNLCTDTYEGTISRLKELQNHVVAPVMYKPPEKHFAEMVQALLSGLWSFIPVVTTQSFLFLAKRFSGAPGYVFTEEDRVEQLNYLKHHGQHFERAGQLEKQLREKENLALSAHKELNAYDRFIVNFVVYVCHLTYVSVLWRLFFKFQVHLMRFLINYFPFLAFPRFGIRDSYVRVLRHSATNSAEEP